MMTFYAAAGSYQIRSEDGKNMPYIMRLGKLQPVSIPEFSLWSMLLWDVLTYAFVDRNGDWIGSGDMGWFGISSNDKDERAWNDEIQKLMNEAKDDDFLAIVDCHI